MKQIKPLYIYLIGIIILVAVIFIFQYESSSVPPTSSGAQAGDNIAGKAMPQDQIHKGLENPLEQKPNKANVMNSVLEHMKELERDVEKNPNDTAKVKEYADFLAQAHQQDKALSFYIKILRKYPDRVDIMSAIVFMEFSRSKFSDCEKYLKKILAIDKNNLDAMYNLGVVYANEGKKKDAKETWTRIIEKYPSTSMAEKAKKSIEQL